ncbi:9299_t:CDS:2, partial [Scutellospora calospora]
RSTFDNGSNNARAGIGVFWKKNDSKNLSERLPGSEQTNNHLFVKMKRLIENRIGTIKFIHIRGHQGNYDNEQVDRLAKQGLLKEFVKEVE